MLKYLGKLERKYSRFAIENLMLIICAGQLLVYFADITTGGGISAFLYLSWHAVCRGQVWRLFSFIFVPEGGNILTFLLGLYFYYMIGGALENEWGSFNFNCFYLIGVVGCIISAAITGYGSSYYINMSMFFAFALLYPDYRVMLFYILPIKVKWIALADALFFVFCFIVIPGARVSIIMSLVNILIFFIDRLILDIRMAILRYRNRRRFRNNWK